MGPQGASSSRGTSLHERPEPRPVLVGSHCSQKGPGKMPFEQRRLAAWFCVWCVFIARKNRFQAGGSAPRVGQRWGAGAIVGLPGQPHGGPCGVGLPVCSCGLSDFPPLSTSVGAVPGQGAATGHGEGLPGPAAPQPALRGGQEAGWMFTIITQLQLPQSCRHSNGAGRPSRAAKWQEGGGCPGQVGGGVARAPGAAPGSLCQLPVYPPPPQRPGAGLCLGTGRLAQPRGGSSRRPIRTARAHGVRGSRCEEGCGCSGSLWLRARLWGMLVPPPHCLLLTPGPQGLIPHSAVFPLQRGVCGHWVPPGKDVYDSTHLACQRGSYWSRAQSRLGQDQLWGLLPVRVALGPRAVFGDPQNPPLMTPIPLHSIVEALSASSL